MVEANPGAPYKRTFRLRQSLPPLRLATTLTCPLQPGLVQTTAAWREYSVYRSDSSFYKGFQQCTVMLKTGNLQAGNLRGIIQTA